MHVTLTNIHRSIQQNKKCNNNTNLKEYKRNSFPVKRIVKMVSIVRKDTIDQFRVMKKGSSNTSDYSKISELLADRKYLLSSLWITILISLRTCLVSEDFPYIFFCGGHHKGLRRSIKRHKKQ